jgi:hypothetical protein
VEPLSRFNCLKSSVAGAAANTTGKKERQWVGRVKREGSYKGAVSCYLEAVCRLLKASLLLLRGPLLSHDIDVDTHTIQQGCHIAIPLVEIELSIVQDHVGELQTVKQHIDAPHRGHTAHAVIAQAGQR